jgi:hypothetical protein
MLRRLVAVVWLSVVGVGLALADDIKAKVKSVDVDKSTITFTVDDKDQTLPVAKDAKISKLEFQKEKGKKKGKLEEVPVSGGLGGLTAGQDVTITTEKVDEKDTVTAVKLNQAPMKKGKKNKDKE